MTVCLQIVVSGALRGVTYAVQIGRDGLMHTTDHAGSSLIFDLPVTLREDGRGSMVFRGESVQGRGQDQFIYLNSGKRAGQKNSCWDRRAKLMLTEVTEPMRRRLLKSGGTLLGRVHGAAADGGPCCARVPLLSGGWQI